MFISTYFRRQNKENEEEYDENGQEYGDHRGEDIIKDKNMINNTTTTTKKMVKTMVIIQSKILSRSRI